MSLLGSKLFEAKYSGRSTPRYLDLWNDNPLKL